MIPPLVTLEEHFFSSVILDGLDNKYSEQFKHIPGLAEQIRDLDTVRLQSMDAGKVTLQVVSHGPGSITTDQCKAANDQLAAAVKKNSKRLAGFAVLPVSDPDSSAQELTRCIKELGFVGALIDNHTENGTYYDGPEYTPLFQAAQDLDVPIYLHPTWPTEAVKSLIYNGNYTKGATMGIGASGFGWHSDVAMHVLRLFCAGVFDTFPGLKIIVGHMGEMLPFMLHRIMQLSPRWGERQRNFKEVYDTNIWITTSGVWSVDPMACILRNTKIDHILYSVDYPFAKNEDGLAFMEDLEKSGLVNEEQFGMVAYKNAEALLGVKAQS